MLRREAYGCSAGHQNLYGYSDIGDVEKYQMFQSLPGNMVQTGLGKAIQPVGGRPL